jgi:GLPGLI family protein
MNKIFNYLVVLVFGLTQTLAAQNLVLSGKITYERKENLHKQFTEKDSWTEAFLKTLPKYKTDFFELSFNTTQSAYKISAEDEAQIPGWLKTAATNLIWQNFKDTQIVAVKQVFENNYIIEDSLPTYEWKYLGEFREIAGYTCRKASTILFDSVYVIAFYTEQIPVAGGPESFNGLPGMILGIAIPRVNLTYFATKVEPQTLAENVFIMPKQKGKKTNFKAFRDEITKGLKDWGSSGTKLIWKSCF